MGKVNVFNFITLNGFYKGSAGDSSWHRHGTEEAEYSIESLRAANTLLFGRITYEMMAGYWPTTDARKANGLMAEGMNNADKIVFSRTLQKADWNNTRLIRDNMIEEVQRLKQTGKKDNTVLGSGSIITQLAEQNLIDSYEIMIDPVAIGSGTPLFNGITHTLNLKLTGTRTFKSGVVLLRYQSIAQ
jgi:dihydrofolate reductase